MRSTVLDILPYLTAIISYMQHLQIELVLSSVEMFSSLAGNYEKHAPRVSQVIAAVTKFSCKHGLFLIAREKYAPDTLNCARGVRFIYYNLFSNY